MGTVYCHLWLNRSRQEWLCGWGQRQGINPHLWGLWQLVDCSTRMSYVHSRFWKFLRKKDDSACNCFPLCLYLLILLYFFMRKRVLLRVAVKFWNLTEILSWLFLLCVINTVVAGKSFEFCSEIMALQVPIWTATYSFRFFFCRSLLRPEVILCCGASEAVFKQMCQWNQSNSGGLE